jgi:hypothetical protein
MEIGIHYWPVATYAGRRSGVSRASRVTVTGAGMQAPGKQQDAEDNHPDEADFFSGHFHWLHDIILLIPLLLIISTVATLLPMDRNRPDCDKKEEPL